MLVLIVDDCTAMRSLIRRIVTSLGGQTIEAADGRQALEVLSTTPRLPDALLTDWNMPHLSGLDLITAVRSRSEWRDIAIMMVTSESEPHQVARAFAAGAQQYLTKPFTAAALRERLRQLGSACPERQPVSAAA